MAKKCGIYKITNLSNGKVYIGQSENIDRRWSRHKTELKNNHHHSPHLQNSYNLQGIDNFRMEIIEFCEREKLDEKEQYWLDFYQSFKEEKGYNICKKSARSCFGIKRSESTIEKLSKTTFKEGRVSYNKNRKLTEEHKRKIKESEKGKKLNIQIATEMRNKFENQNISKSELCEMYNVSPSCVQRILKYQTHKPKEENDPNVNISNPQETIANDSQNS